jgi:hypothetical protein
MVKHAGIYSSLEEWMVIATKGLTDSSRDRVKVEIEAHFTEAYEEVIGQGLNSQEAEIVALQTLGDPKKSNRALKKELLTLTDENYLRKMRHFSSRRLCLELAILTITMGLYHMAQFESIREWYDDVSVIKVFYFLFCLLFICRLIERPSAVTVWVYRVVTIMLTSFLLYLFAPILLPRNDGFVFIIILAVAVLLSFNGLLRNRAIRRKLPKDDWPNGLYWG